MKSLSQLQKEVEEIDKEFNFNWPLYVRFIHLVEEIGEVGEALTVYQKDRKAGLGSAALADHSNIEEELGDVLFSVFDIANQLKFNLNDVLEKTFARYKKKLEKLSNTS